MRVTTARNIPFRLLDWPDMAKMTEDLARQIQQEPRQYDRFVALANGGLTMVRHLADLLQMDKISLLQIKSYTGIDEKVNKPYIAQPLTMDVEGERLLVFEDIVDTGSTLRAIHEYLQEKQAAEFHVATLVQKSHATVQADFVGAHHDEWIIFPYETRETIQALQHKWSAEGVSESEIEALLVEIGFSPESIQRFWQPK